MRARNSGDIYRGSDKSDTEGQVLRTPRRRLCRGPSLPFVPRTPRGRHGPSGRRRILRRSGGPAELKAPRRWRNRGELGPMAVRCLRTRPGRELSRPGRRRGSMARDRRIRRESAGRYGLRGRPGGPRCHRTVPRDHPRPEGSERRSTGRPRGGARPVDRAPYVLDTPIGSGSAVPGRSNEECSRRDLNPRFVVEGHGSLTGLDYGSTGPAGRSACRGRGNELSRDRDPTRQGATRPLGALWASRGKYSVRRSPVMA